MNNAVSSLNATKLTLTRLLAENLL